MSKEKINHILLIDPSVSTYSILHNIFVDEVTKLKYTATLSGLTSVTDHAHYDILIVEPSHPQKTPLESLNLIKTIFPSTPIIVLTESVPNIELQSQFKALGVIDHFSKSDVDFWLFRKVVLKLISRSAEVNHP